MKRFCVLLCLLSATAAQADLAITRSNGGATLYSKSEGFVTVAECTHYSDLGTSPEQARAACRINPKTVHGDFFKADFYFRETGSYYDSSKILSAEQLTGIRAEIEKIEEHRRKYGDAAVDMNHLAALYARIAANEAELAKKTAFEAERDSFFETIVNESALTIQPTPSPAATYLSGVTIRYSEYASRTCGTGGTLAARILECSRYAIPSALTREHALVARFGGGKSVWLSRQSKFFYHVGAEPIEPDFMNDIVGELWRELTPDEANALPPALSGARVMISEKPVNLDHVRPYRAETVNKKTGEKIVFEYSEGLLTFTLVDRKGNKTLLKKFSHTVDPSKRKFVNGRDRFAYDEMYMSQAIAEGYSGVWEGLIDVLDMGAIILFPISLGVFAIYSTSFLFTIPADGIAMGGSAILQKIPTRETRAQRNVANMLLGKSGKTKDVIFKIMVDKIQRIKL